MATTDTLAASLVAALNELQHIAKGNTAKVETKVGRSYTYTYADLGTVIDAVRPVLAKHNLAVMQDVTSGERQVWVQTVIMHSSGEVRSFGPVGMPAGDTPQTLGSAITYCRRYALLAALGIATEDDDGHAAKGTPPEPEPTYSKKALDAFELCKQQADEIKQELKAFATENGKKVSVAAFDADFGWADMAVAFIRERQK